MHEIWGSIIIVVMRSIKSWKFNLILYLFHEDCQQPCYINKRIKFFKYHECKKCVYEGQQRKDSKVNTIYYMTLRVKWDNKLYL
jgi:hypothetical protein